MAATRSRALLLVLLLAVGPAAFAPPPAAAAGSLSVYLSGLNVPIALAFAPDGRVFYAERNTGTIRVVLNGTPLGAYYALAGTAIGGERGLLGLALDPGFPAAPYVYAYQTYDDVGNGTVYNRVVRIAGDATGSSHVVIAQFPPVAATNHNGGVIAFGPDGKLYVVIGEDANPAHSQDLTTPKGKVLRIESNGSAPTDNPFYGSLTADNRIYSFGHRNMFGLTFHPATNRAYVTENGPNCNDEINVLAPGGNFGWGPTQTCTSPPPPPNNTNRDGPNPILPIDWYTPTTAPTNAAVYLGPGFPAWRGDLIFGEWNSRRLRRLDLGGPGYDVVLGRQDILTAPQGILEVESGPDGAIWFTTGTTIYRYHDTAQPPVASFVAAPDRTIPGADITFDASASSDPDGMITSFAWDFGDGVLGAGQVTTHAYGAPGTYVAALTVTDNETLTDTATRTVTIDAPPGALFTISPSPAEPGEVVTFDATASNGSGRIVRYDWAFGDGAFGSGAVATHAYAAPGTYSITLVVEDNASLTDSDTQTLRVNAPPEPALAVNATQSFIGVPLRFDGSSSRDPDGTIASFAWEFGDGANATGATATHAYAAKGTFTATLTVVDNDGRSNATMRVVAIVNRPPRIVAANPTVEALNTHENVPLTLMVVATDPDADALTYAWTVDGFPTNETSATLVFSSDAEGQHTVVVTVSDGAESVAHSWTVFVLPPELPPPNPWLAVTLAVLLAFAITLVAFLLWRRRRRKE